MSVDGSAIEDGFEPKIIGFLCRWCAYPGADLAGTSRLKYPPNMIPIRVMCSGRVDPAFVLKALADLDGGIEHSFGKPTKFELVHDQKRYAPKAVVGIACR